MAELVASTKNVPAMKFYSAELEPSGFDELTRQALSSLGVPSDSLKARGIHDLDGMEIDIVVLIGAEIEKESPFLPGNPVTLFWNIKKIQPAASLEDAKKNYAELKNNISKK